MPVSECAKAQDPGRVAVIKLEFYEEDSVKYITAYVNEFNNDSTGAPIEEIDIYFYVERFFSLLPIGDIFNTTDENGQVTIEFPGDLPGDSVGNVTIISKIEEDPDYGDLEVRKTLNWGVPIVIDVLENKRSLWAARANSPISLLILSNSIIAAVWGVILYILYQLLKISRIK
jgi:hypothetical protein